jgi:hypothetical protein
VVRETENSVQRIIPTSSEIFSDDIALELIAEQIANGHLTFLVWDGRRAKVSPRFEHHGLIYEPCPLDPSVAHGIRFPSKKATYGSTRHLFEQIVDLIKNNFDLPVSGAQLLTFFSFSSWFADCLPTAPGLIISGSGDGEAGALLDLLGCLCRRSLILSGITAEGFSGLPMHLHPTLLIDRPRLTAQLRVLLRASNRKGLRVPRRGRLLDLHWSKALYCGTDIPDRDIADFMIHVAVAPAERHRLALDEQSREDVANKFQAQFLAYRLANYRKVANSRFDVPEFAYPMRGLAHALGACIADDKQLALSLVPLLQQRDEQLRSERGSQEERAIIEAVLACFHRGDKNQVSVAYIADFVNSILRARGEILEFSSEEIGRKLNALGLYKKRTNAGMSLILSRENSHRVHDLARRYDVPPAPDVAAQCADCVRSQAGDTRQV